MSNHVNNKSMLRIGTILHDTYRIEGYLSSGGFGNTYIATNIEFEERYAVKEFFMRGISQRDNNNTTVSVSNADNQATFESQLEKFKKEARRLRKLHSEHIVRVYDLFEENGTAYYVMDFVDGENLSERLKRTGKPMTEDEVMNHLLPQILDALDAAHKDGILHLDLKPANIMLDRQGLVRLIDFGASKQQKANGSGATTDTTTIAYTPGYAPIEQIEQNLEDFGPWTDFYALGATLFCLLTNQNPPVPSKIRRGQLFTDNKTLNQEHYLSETSKQLIAWLMSYEPKSRPQSVEEIIHSGNNEAFLEGQNSEQTLYASRKGEKESNERSNINQNKKNVKNNTKKKILLLFSCLALLVIFIIALPLRISDNKSNGANSSITTESPDTINNEDGIHVTKKKCNVMQGNCIYTGEVNESGIPNGEGEANFNDGRYYKGKFKNGMMVDEDASFRYPNGDTYKGSFIDDHFSKGKYTIYKDKSYFIGSYDEQGQPKEGAWYDRNGKKIQNV